jgi:hypothetical protein
MPNLSDSGRKAVEDLAERHGVSPGAVTTLLDALIVGHGNQAQFSHPDLGGMGQWSQGGMIMVGDMFNNALKAKVDALCTELAGLLRAGGALATPPAASQSQSQSGGGGASLFVGGSSPGSWWPEGLGAAGSVGAQNEMRYATFPTARRLAISVGGKVTVYDTGDHVITGFSQQQGAGQSLTFTSQHGTVRVADLPVVSGAPASGIPAATVERDPERPPAAAGKAAEREPERQAAAAGEADIVSQIERLAGLRDRKILSDAEFQAKKTELLSRL